MPSERIKALLRASDWLRSRRRQQKPAAPGSSRLEADPPQPSPATRLNKLEGLWSNAIAQVDMHIPTKALLVGVACGLLVAGLGVANTYRLERNVETLRAACVAEGKREANAPDAPPWVKYAELKCDPRNLIQGMLDLDTNSLPPGIQGELVRAQQALDAANTRDWLLIGLAIAAGFGLPWFWYFLLNRIKELRQALIGK